MSQRAGCDNQNVSSTSAEQLKERGPFRRWNVVPNARDVASYSFVTQVIELSDVDAEAFARGAEGSPAHVHNITRLLAHELRHWIDHIGSVWGQRLLRLGYDAIHARASNLESELWRVVQYHRSLRDTRFERYFRLNGQPSPSERRKWIANFSAGYRYDHEGIPDPNSPILFTRFSYPSGALACRVPLSIASLLECAAQHYELETASATLLPLGPSSLQPAFAALQELLLDQMYSIERAEYSVAAHAVANHASLTDCPNTLKAGSLLAGIALSLSDHHFDSLVVPQKLSSFGDRNRAFISKKDRGYAFLAMVLHAPPFTPEKPISWVEQTLRTAGLPEIAVIKDEALGEMERIGNAGLPGFAEQVVASELELGRNLFREHGPLYVFENVVEALHQLSLPLVVLGSDLSIVFDGRVEAWDASAVGREIDRILNMYAANEEFLDACGA